MAHTINFSRNIFYIKILIGRGRSLMGHRRILTLCVSCSQSSPPETIGWEHYSDPGPVCTRSLSLKPDLSKQNKVLHRQLIFSQPPHSLSSRVNGGKLLQIKCGCLLSQRWLESPPHEGVWEEDVGLSLRDKRLYM